MSNLDIVKAGLAKADLVTPAQAATALSTAFRAAPPAATAGPQLGPLANLPGNWVGRGFSLTALPDHDHGAVFRVKLNATTEILNFTAIGGPVPNRGSVEPDLFFVGLHYFQQVVDAPTSTALHIEPGIWLNMPAITVPAQGPTVIRMGTVPHGDSLLAQGSFLTVKGGPIIQAVDTTPFKLDPITGARQNDTNPVYLAPYHNAVLPAGIPAGAVANPNIVIQNAIIGQNIVETVVLIVNATPVGGINGTPILPPAHPSTVGGILNIPYVTANANANSLSAIFWIETVQNADGTEFLQLQYTQTTLLEFAGLKWPHVAVATLIKQ